MDTVLLAALNLEKSHPPFTTLLLNQFSTLHQQRLKFKCIICFLHCYHKDSCCIDRTQVFLFLPVHCLILLNVRRWYGTD